MQKPEKNPKSAQGAEIDDEIISGHWADNAAKDLIQKHPGKSDFVCASGISPSGVVHIGNFREVFTSELVVRALRDKGKKVRFLYSWDDYDAFRKVPANLPNQEKLAGELRKPLSDFPDPLGTDKSYASHFEKLFESEISQLGIEPDYIYQNEAYRSCKYADGIRIALENQSKIAEILNRYRTEPLPASWSCVTVYSATNGKDDTKIIGYEAPNTIRYFCREAKKELTTDFTKEGLVKLLWRVDWPMRWAHEGVDFEPGGKDHSSQGGSYETGVVIAREIYKVEPPHYVQYDFVLAKGLGAKLSSSSGNLISVSQALEVYEPAVIRWIFASRKPNLDFTIAFDLDVMKAYDDFDRCERYAFGAEEGEPKRVNYEKRIYELSCTAHTTDADLKGKPLPPQFGIRHLCNILQIFEGDQTRAQSYYQELLSQPGGEARYKSRATRAWNWIQNYAPEAFRFKIRPDGEAVPAAKYPEAVKAIVELLEDYSTKPKVTESAGVALYEEKLASDLFEIMKANSLDAKTFFPEVYGILINKPSGPKLGSFLLTMGVARAAAILKRALK
jgi:lysyl-tRNA synthetase, class I